ncbi:MULTISPECIES: Ig-like domain-containing protein [unclassified Parabacteroides]|uniref:Ig-like domain-containing protein n=1 Tax=unclassified Parabacteroides TaxID=2649774 RepID=UPI000F00E63F|nr:MULTISPECIES: Ig-like domain-containing protein [unclassified Parabacteroides]RHO67461.1 hypothetical protein DW083_17475 [Parabacteroides sp. AF48-14]RHR62215.1 hypothetical protein DWW90_02065 [Parabacteroides sp. AF17-28]
MDNKYIRNSFRLLYGMLLLVVIYSCANIGSPNGGPYDEDPPKFVSSTPVPNQVNYKGKKIEILFDELIQIDKPSENVIITPPQMELPIIRSAGKKAVIELKDTLKENTTYTIDFTNSIADNNEKNVYENFSFAFSTGDVIDTLEVSGVLLNAENLEPMPGITIGLHSNLEDSAFVKLPFDRTSRTNDKGQFTIRNIAPGTYHIFALNDVNRDYKFDQPGEDIAFLDSVIVPTFELTSRQDTAWKDSLTIDTIRTVGYTRFMPDNIELRLFKEKFERQYMVKPERPDEKYFTLRFNSKLDTVPVPVPINFTPEDSAWYFVQQTEGGLAVNYWLADSTVWKQDTLQVQVSYPKSDSLNILRPQTDTVQVVMRRRPAEKKKKKKDEPEPIDFLGMQVNASGSMNLFDTISVTFSEPVLDINEDMFFLDQKVDTVWNAVDFEFFPDTTNSLNFFIKRPWKYGEEYRIEVDSAAITSLYGKWNNFFTSEFKIKKEDEYGHFYLNIVGVDTTAFVELLSSGDAPVRKAKVKDGGVLFMDLKPDKYYARIIIDTNDNGVWDTGNYAEKRQPEKVYYSPKMYEIMQNWQVEETWNVTSTPLAKQKPLEITKNKPKEVTKKKRNYKDESQQSSSRNNSGGNMGMPF